MVDFFELKNIIYDNLQWIWSQNKFCNKKCDEVSKHYKSSEWTNKYNLLNK